MVIVILSLLGLIFGSFVNALVWRLHEQAKSKKGKAKQDSSNLSIWKGRSMCPNCHHMLSAADLVPLFSWLALKGKCRYCRKPISWQYPLVEALTACLFIFSYIFWPNPLHTAYSWVLFGFWLIFLTGFMALAVYDFRWQILPDKIVSVLTVLALIQIVILLIHGPLGSVLWSVVASALVGGGIFYLIFQVSQGKWIGGGDVKLGFLLGLVLANGWLMTLAIFTASVLGTLAALPLLMSGKARRQTKIPFGPFLIIGAIIAQLFGAAIVNWYKTKLVL